MVDGEGEFRRLSTQLTLDRTASVALFLLWGGRVALGWRGRGRLGEAAEQPREEVAAVAAAAAARIVGAAPARSRRTAGQRRAVRNGQSFPAPDIVVVIDR